jgi:hypothetical protein
VPNQPAAAAGSATLDLLAIEVDVSLELDAQVLESLQPNATLPPADGRAPARTTEALFAVLGLTANALSVFGVFNGKLRVETPSGLGRWMLAAWSILLALSAVATFRWPGTSFAASAAVRWAGLLGLAAGSIVLGFERSVVAGACTVVAVASYSASRTLIATFRRWVLPGAAHLFDRRRRSRRKAVWLLVSGSTLVFASGLVTGEPDAGGDPSTTSGGRQQLAVVAPLLEQRLPLPSWLSPCEFAPGSGVEVSVRTWNLMIEGINAGAAEAFGCLARAVARPDGTIVQEFEYEGAAIIATEHAAGIISFPNAGPLRKMGDGDLSAASLGGLLLDRFNCYEGHGDIQAITDSAGRVVTLLVHPSKSQHELGTTRPLPPLIVPMEMLKEFETNLHDGKLLAPLTDAKRTDGVVTQRFYDPLAPRFGSLTFRQTLSDVVHPSLAVTDLFQACNPGAEIPVALKTTP